MDEQQPIPLAEPSEPVSALPSREELQAELLDVPDEPEQPKQGEPSGQTHLEQILGSVLRYVRGKRGGDLLAAILVGSGARRALTPHSDLDVIAVIKGQDEGQEMIRVSDRLIEIRYRGHKAVEQELGQVLRLPPLLRKGRVLFEHEAAGTKLLEKAQQRFRSGPPPLSMHEKIRLKAECLHWLGKAEDLSQQTATAQYLLGIFLESLLEAFFRLRGFWPTAPSDTLRFVMSRDTAAGELLDRFMTTPTLPDRLALARDLTDRIFADVPNPPRVD
jgi:predicted nucleotidyltransferase